MHRKRPMEEANYRRSFSTPADVFPTAGVPTVSGIFSTPMRISIISAKDKGKEKVTKTKVPKKKKLQEQIDAQVAREMEEEFARENQRSNEVIAKHLNEYEQAEVDLSVGEKIELINELVKYQDHLAKILKYQAQQSKPPSKKEQMKFYISVLKSHAGYKTKHFKGMTLEQIKEKFIPAFPLPGIEFHWQKKFPLLAKKVATARRKEMPLPRRLHCYQSQEETVSQGQMIVSLNCKKNTETLNKKIIDLEDKLFDAKNMIYHYKLGLELVESRLVECKKSKVKYCEKIRTLEFRTESSNECIEILKKKLETLKQEKERVDGKLAGLLTSSKDLDNLIESQRADKNKEGLGYSDVPPPPAQIYSSPKKDMSWTGLPEFVDDTVTNYSRPSPTIESTSGDDQNKNPSVTKIGASDSTILSKPAIKFVKAIGKATERPTTDKVETTKKPTVRYAKLYRKPSKKSTVRGNQRNWNNLKSQQLANNFVIKKKACYNCGHFDHLSYDCGLGVKIGRSSPKNNYTHMSMTPRSAINRPYRPPMRPMRPNINDARPIKTSFYKPAHSYTKRPFQETTQDLMIILIHKVKRPERELKARTLVYKVDRGRSRPGRIVGNKMHKAFPLPGIEFPLAEEVPNASEEGCHCQKKRDATARKIALLSKSRRNYQSKSNDSFTKLCDNNLRRSLINSFHHKQAIRDKEKEIWVELKRNQDIFMLVEKDNPLRKGLATMMIVQDEELFEASSPALRAHSSQEATVKGSIMQLSCKHGLRYQSLKRKGLCGDQAREICTGNLKEVGMEDCNATLCPMEPGLKLSKEKDEPAVCQAIWLRKLLAEITRNDQVIFERKSGDNQRAYPLRKALECKRFKEM
nr:ubiquitin hydrolase [Tanacetum cinerariifolium]